MARFKPTPGRHAKAYKIKVCKVRNTTTGQVKDCKFKIKHNSCFYVAGVYRKYCEYYKERAAAGGSIHNVDYR